MKYINNLQAPEPFFRAVKNDTYDSGGSDFTATSLANPPKVYALMKKYGEGLETEANTRVASLIGQAIHKLAERAARPGIDLVEQRYFSKFLGYKVSAQIDLLEQDTGILYDWKSTKAYAFHQKTGAGQKPEYITQMNIGLELLRRNNLEARELHIIALLKDWDEKKAEADPGYPQSEVIEVSLPIWSREKTVAYIEERIQLHVKALKELPECSSKDTWGGNRCRRWCDVNSVCEQYKAVQALKTNKLFTKE